MVTEKSEKFLGPSYYLMKLKKKIFIYSFVKQMKSTAFVGLQIMTIVLIFTIAILSRSLMSLGYMILCIPLFIYLKDFFYQDKKERNNSNISWINPLIISYPLMYFIFIDIALQILYQIPID